MLRQYDGGSGGGLLGDYLALEVYATSSAIAPARLPDPSTAITKLSAARRPTRHMQASIPPLYHGPTPRAFFPPDHGGERTHLLRSLIGRASSAHMTPRPTVPAGVCLALNATSRVWPVIVHGWDKRTTFRVGAICGVRCGLFELHQLIARLDVIGQEVCHQSNGHIPLTALEYGP